MKIALYTYNSSGKYYFVFKCHCNAKSFGFIIHLIFLEPFVDMIHFVSINRLKMLCYV